MSAAGNGESPDPAAFIAIDPAPPFLPDPEPEADVPTTGLGADFRAIAIEAYRELEAGGDPWPRLLPEERAAHVAQLVVSRARQVDDVFRVGWTRPGALERYQEDRKVYAPSEAPGGTDDARPWPAQRSAVDPARVLEDDWAVEHLLRRRRLLVIAGAEGIGKSRVRMQLEAQLATGGALFGHYRIPTRRRVLTFDVENGEEEETRREEEMLPALGLTRAALTHCYRASLDGLGLTDQADQAYVREAIARVRPDVVIFDTGSSMVGDEWGPELKSAIRFLRSLAREYGCAIVILVHLVKPARQANGQQPGRRRGAPDPARPHGTSLFDVMGQWTRQADAVALMADAGAERVLWTVRKRVAHSQLVLAGEDGVFRSVQVVAGDDLGANTLERVYRCVTAGADDARTVAEYLGLTVRTVQRHVATLRREGRIPATSGATSQHVAVAVAAEATVSQPVAPPVANGSEPVVSHRVAGRKVRHDTATPPLIEGGVSHVAVAVAADEPEFPPLELTEPPEGTWIA